MDVAVAAEVDKGLPDGTNIGVEVSHGVLPGQRLAAVSIGVDKQRAGLAGKRGIVFTGENGVRGTGGFKHADKGRAEQAPATKNKYHLSVLSDGLKQFGTYARFGAIGVMKFLVFLSVPVYTIARSAADIIDCELSANNCESMDDREFGAGACSDDCQLLRAAMG